MIWIVTSMKPDHAGVVLLTCTMLYATVAPQAALQSTFGDTLQGPAAEIVVRNWGMLIGLVGAMLIYGAFNIAARPLVLTVAGLSKATFIVLMLVLGRPFLSHQAGVAVVSYLIQFSLFVGYLLSAPRRRTAGV